MTFRHIWLLGALFLCTLPANAQSLQVDITSDGNRNSFCEGIPEYFYLTANPSGGQEPYTYAWIRSWDPDTLWGQEIRVRPEESGEVRLTVTDSSHPAKSKDAVFRITEVIMNADFTFNLDGACAQTPILFSPVVSGGSPSYSYYWDFGDGTNSTEKNPIHEFISPDCSGTSDFRVWLTVYDANGCYTSVEKSVQVKNKPFLDFSDEGNPFTPFKHCHPMGTPPEFFVELHNQTRHTTCITSYDIDWGDETEDLGAIFPIRHDYNEVGAFKIKITATNSSGCELVWTQIVYNQSSPAAGLESYGGTEGCAPIEFSFGLEGYETNSVGTTYTWDFGDGSPPVVWDHDDPFDTDTIAHLYEKTSCLYGGPFGDYTTVVTVNNGCGEIEATVTGVRVWTKPGAYIRGAGIDTICTNEAVRFGNYSREGYYGASCGTVAEYFWTFGNEDTSWTADMPLYSWSEPGIYEVELTATNLCGSTTDDYPIVVLAPPEADALLDETAGCVPFVPAIENTSTGQGLEYLWQISPDRGYSFLNGTDEENPEPEISFNQSGSYQLVLYVQNVCDQYDSIVYTINAFTKPSGSIKDLSDRCIADPVVYPRVDYNDHGSPISLFSWDFPGGNPSSASTEDPGEVSYASAGDYFVNLVLENACGSLNLKDSFSVYEIPDITVRSPVSVCESSSLVISGTTVSNATSILWESLGDGYFDNDTLENPIYNPGTGDIGSLGTDLRIIARGEPPCLADTAIVSVGIQELPGVQVDEDAFICEGNAYEIRDAMSSNYDYLQWSSSGDGNFSDPGIMRPIYDPGPGDLALGQVDLWLTARAITPCILDASDTMRIIYGRNPVVDIGPDRDICEDGKLDLFAEGTGIESLSWKLETGEGSFSDPSSRTPVFTLASGFTGDRVILSIEALGGFGCDPVYDTLVLRVIPRPEVFAGDDASVCETGTYQLSDASVAESSEYYWRVNGDGFLDDPFLLNPVYTPGLADIAAGRASLRLIAEGNSVCAADSAEITVNIQASPQSFAGEDQDVCKVNDFITSGEQIHGASIQWNSLGSGTFENEAELLTTYYPSAADKDRGSVDLVLRVDALAPCFLPDYDTVHLSFIDPPEVFAGDDTTICSPSFVPVDASVSNSAAYIWSSGGSGSLLDPGSLTPTYFTSEADLSAGSVVLTLTSTNPTCPPVSDSMEVSLTPYPVAEAGSDDVICEDAVKSLDGSLADHYTNLIWSTEGDGFFDDHTRLHPSYVPGPTDILQGSVKLLLTATGIPPCSTPAFDSITLSIQRNPFVYAGPDTIIGEGEVFISIEARASFVSQVSWSTLGDGTFIFDSRSMTYYTPGEADLRNRGVYLVIRGSAILPCGTEATDTLFLQIMPKPRADAGVDVDICEGSDLTISTAFAEEYSEIFWTTRGTGLLENASTLTPSYHPSPADIEKRVVVLSLHARGKDPIEHIVVSDSMEIHMVHNAQVDALPLDTACENSVYQINDVIYQDVNTLSWSSSGGGFFNGTREMNPIFTFSANDSRQDSVYFYLEVTSMQPCVHVARDTVLIRLYHEPEPLFDYTNPEGCAPLRVSFLNNSSGEDLSYYWDLGNGLESFYKDPGITVYQQGRIADTTYTVTLEATNRCNSVSMSKDILVKPVPITDFGMDVAWGCSPMEIQFFNVTTGLPATYLWRWGDGTGSFTEEQPGSHVFETGDQDTTYTISLFAENECGADSMQKSVIIFPSSVDAFFETDTTFGCAPLEVSFTNYSRGVLGDEAFLNWSWNFGDGNSLTETLNPVHVFEKPGTYTVSLYVNDTCSRDTFSTEIRVMEAPRAEFMTDRTEYCEHDSVFLTPVDMSIADIASMTWDFGDATEGYDFNDVHVYDTSGVITITLMADHIQSGCTAIASREITIHPAPVAAFNIPENDGCAALQITFQNETEGADFYTWDFDNGNSSVDVDARETFTEAGTYDIILRATDSEGCSDSIGHRLLVNPKPLAAFESSSLLSCFAPVDVEFSNLSEGAEDYRWDFGNGSGSSATDPVVRYSDFGDFPISLIATNSFSCADTSDMVYHVYHMPVADFRVDTTIGCDPFIVHFTNQSDYGIDYRWSFGDQGISLDEDPNYVFRGEGEYSVSLVAVGLGGCSDSISREDYITTYPSPRADFDYTRDREIDTILFHNYSFGAISYLWNFGDGLFSEEMDPWHMYNSYGSYVVSLTASNEYNCTDTVYETIDFEIYKGLFFPNAFAPENVSEDVREFKAVGMGLVQFHLLVYDTWGNLLWETDKLERGSPVESWDGTFEGKALPPDVYVWHLKEAIFKDGTSYEGKRYGTITLIK